jgi:hypothetical protein
MATIASGTDASAKEEADRSSVSNANVDEQRSTVDILSPALFSR